MERDNVSAYMCPLAPLPVPKTFVFGTTHRRLNKRPRTIHNRTKTRFKTMRFETFQIQVFGTAAFSGNSDVTSFIEKISVVPR